MGYESRIYVVDVHTDWEGEKWAEKLAVMNLCVMGGNKINGKSFRDLFNKEIDYKFYINIEITDEEEKTNLDNYMEHIKSGNIDEIIAWLEECSKTEKYRRIKPLLNMLKGYKAENWEHLEVLHYGY